jgi:hypothetical protein
MGANTVQDIVRAQGFAPIAADIPGELTIDAYRRSRAQRQRAKKRKLRFRD